MTIDEIAVTFPKLKDLISLSAEVPELRIISHIGKPGKFAALQTGVKAVAGDFIFFTDADYPFDLSFFDNATHELKSGYHFVVGDRRHSKSQVLLPFRQLFRAHLREKIGSVFNSVVRMIFSEIQVKDTQAGIKAMTYDFAKSAFEAQCCPGFYGDIELFLAAEANGFKYQSLPVVFRFGENKSSVRFCSEIFSAMKWLSKIFLRKQLGMYRVPNLQSSGRYRDSRSNAQTFENY
jgi:dolichyl-phosphate beta-glucosyltransferase